MPSPAALSPAARAELEARQARMPHLAAYFAEKAEHELHTSPVASCLWCQRKAKRELRNEARRCD